MEQLLCFLHCRAGEYEKARGHLQGYLAKHEGLLRSDLASSMLKDVRSVAKGFEDLPWPTCGKCSACPALGCCSYGEWQAMNGKLERVMHRSPLHQENLEELFAY